MKRIVQFVPPLPALSVVAVLGIALGVWGYQVADKWLRPAPAESARSASALLVDARQLDFGDAWETEKFVWRLGVHNPGPDPARVTTLSAGCGCVASDSVSETISPGQSRDIPFEVDLRNKCASAEPKEFRNVEIRLPVRIEPHSAIPTAPWVLHGRVRSAITVPVRNVDLGRAAVASPSQPRVLAVRALTDLSQPKVNVEGAGVVTEPQATSDPRSWSLVIGKAANLRPGHYAATVILRPVTRAGDEATPVRIPVEFDILGDVQADAPAVAFGCCRVGETAEGRVSLTSLSGRPFHVAKWTAEPTEGVEVRPEGEAGPTQFFSIRQRVTAIGDRNGTLRFSGQDAEGTSFQITVELRCFGTEAL